MRYEWDKAKNRSNIAKHGIDFADAVAVFEDPLALTRPDDASRGEARYATLGLETSIRIISARQTTRQERKAYES